MKTKKNEKNQIRFYQKLDLSENIRIAASVVR